MVENDVWIGCNMTILSGVHIGKRATIAAGVVVTNDILPYCIAEGYRQNILSSIGLKMKLYLMKRRSIC